MLAPSIRKQILVEASQARAFRVFTTERRSIAPCGTVPKAVTDSTAVPGVRTESPPSRPMP